MAVKKKSGSTASKAGAKKGATKKAASAKAGGAKGAAKKAGGAKKAAPVKLNDRQREFLSRIKSAGEGGYHMGQKAEERTLEALRERKLVKRGAKDKVKGTHPYTLSRAGEKHLTSGSSSS
jgi:hypothetical protein